MDQELLIECMRATQVNDNNGGFTAPTSFLENKLGKSIKTENVTSSINPQGASNDKLAFNKEGGVVNKLTDKKLTQKVEEVEDDEEFVDEFNSFETGDPDNVNDDPEVAVIDTELTNDYDADTADYIGKYVVICPICLNPLFSDIPEGEVYCPICDKDVEITGAVGKVVDPDVSTNEVVGETEITDEAGKDEGATTEDEIKADESVNKVTESKSYTDLTVDDLDKDRSGGNPEEVLADYKAGKISDKRMKTFLKESKSKRMKLSDGSNLHMNLGKTSVSAWMDCDDGLICSYSKYNMTQDEVAKLSDNLLKSIDKSMNSDEVMSVLGKYLHDDFSSSPGTTESVNPVKAGKKASSLNEDVDVEVKPCGTVNVCVNNEASEGAACVVDDVDTDSLDSQITNILPEIVEDEDVEYKTETVTRKGNGLVFEGSIKSGSNKLPIKLICTETKSRINKLIIEGITGIVGKLMVRSEYDPEVKSMKFESIGYKLLTKEGAKSVILNKKLG